MDREGGDEEIFAETVGEARKAGDCGGEEVLAAGEDVTEGVGAGGSW